MIFVISQQLSTLSLYTSALRARMAREVTGVDNGFMAIRIIDMNPVHTVVLDLESLSTPWLRAFSEACPDVRCLALGQGKIGHAELGKILPPDTEFIADPIDWDETARRIETAIVEAPDDGEGICSAGLEGPLALLAMSNKDAEIVVSAGARVGRMLISGGMIVSAQCDTETGEQAVFAMMTWPSPYVRTLPLREVNYEVSLPITHMLHEAARRLDEIDRLREDAGMAHIMASLRATPGFRSATLINLDSGSEIVSCGERDGVVHAVRAATASARAWAGEVTPRRSGPARGSLSWSEHALAVSVRVHHRFALAVVSGEIGAADVLVASAGQVAAQLTTQIEQAMTGAAPDVQRSIAW